MVAKARFFGVLTPKPLLCPPAQQNPEADAAWRLLQFCWNRNYVGTWQALTGHQWSAQVRRKRKALPPACQPAPAELRLSAASVHNTCNLSRPSLPPRLPLQVQPLVEALVEKTRQRMTKLLAAAYSQVRPRQQLLHSFSKNACSAKRACMLVHSAPAAALSPHS